MHFLGRFRILPKILAIVLLLAATMAALSYVAITALSAQNENAEKMAVAATRSLQAARARQRVIAMNRAEFRGALDPTGENRSAARKVLEEQLAQFHELMDSVSKTTDSKVQAMLPGVQQSLSAYEQTMKQSMAATDAAASQKITETAEKLRETVMTSRAAAEKLSADITAVADRLDERVQEFSRKTSDEYASTSRTLIVISVTSVLAGTLVGFLIGQFGIAGPIRSIVALLQQLAAGRYDIDIHSSDRNDEVGEVAKTALAFKENGLAKLRMEAEAKESEARAATQRKADMVQLANSFETAVGEIVDTVSSASTELEASAGTLTTSAGHSQQLATTVAAASEQASANVQSVASATEELSSSVGEISRQVQESARMAGDAVGQARATTERVSELSKAATRISDVVELINTIASQTNLLALNATIEAARAGEAGRGFAVVASEVKALAEQTAKATDEISQQISGIQAATQDSVASIKEISGTIERLSEVSSAIAAAVEEQGAATQEISRNVQQAAQGTHEVSTNIGSVQRGAAETGSASSQVLSAAQSLASDSNRLKLEVGRFLSSVRAA
ncbi:methyl-accepting chemotaxis protein [Bradyrhizobium sp. CCGUVB1N3]|uniref:methyl-accepting chemotaxis protein n=1 Tax=Bradyrhizobium sp. CCGUVB1N3 TaxID=2949629 RepID=UPI0020B3A6ED|nr:methyl-accepting chemotaxis protein [Bradyrhizobium sp. CCGUVB1N3]MCP3470571.1 methyl-accepting chemotaxis protein [Bradyrhizobium sp. CCGUVB1N3]